jgi:2-haloacid dehalogenase
MTVDFDPVRALTFDCYGTLIDWEAGITGALGPLLRQRGARPFTDDELLQAYAGAESRVEAGAYVPYRQILGRVTRDLAAGFGASLEPGDDEVLTESIGDWPAFPDTRDALCELAGRFQLVILSNIDRDLFALSHPKLGVEFARIITAEDVRSYKPALGHFREALRRTGLVPGQICHVAQSLFHDIAVARPLGLRTVWIDRRGGKRGAGATPASAAAPDLRFPDLRSLVRHIELA